MKCTEEVYVKRNKTLLNKNIEKNILNRKQIDLTTSAEKISSGDCCLLW